MNGLNRIKITYNPETKQHAVYGWGEWFYPNSPDRIYEDWEPLFPIEKVEDWKERLIEIIEKWIETDNQPADAG